MDVLAGRACDGAGAELAKVGGVLDARAQTGDWHEGRAGNTVGASEAGLAHFGVGAGRVGAVGEDVVVGSTGGAVGAYSVLQRAAGRGLVGPACARCMAGGAHAVGGDGAGLGLVARLGLILTPFAQVTEVEIIVLLGTEGAGIGGAQCARDASARYLVVARVAVPRAQVGLAVETDRLQEVALGWLNGAGGAGTAYDVLACQQFI